MSITTPNIPVPRVVLRIYPIGIKDKPPMILAHATDGSLWELVRGPNGERWVALPPLPQASAP